MTEHVGRHASDDTGETLILPALTGLDRPEPSVPQAGRGRHASRRPAADARDLPSPGPAAEPGLAAADEAASQETGKVANGAVGPAAGVAVDPAVDVPGEAAVWPAPERTAVTFAAVRPRAAARGGGPVRLVWVYPDLLSTYGDRGNLLVLTRRAELRGLEVQAIEIKSDEPVPEDGDIYLLGGGEDLPQILAASRLRADGGLHRAAERGAVVFAVCAGYQLMGCQFGGVEGESVAGLGILDVTSGRGQRRGVGEIVADVDPALDVPRLTGFENHQGVTHIGPGARPLARVTLGVGNGDGTEGAYAGHILGTYLHGPALARNPGLADLLLSWVVGPLQPLPPQSEDWARQLRGERLAATGS